jgi:hypothetical protein
VGVSPGGFDDPRARRVRGGVEVQNAAAAVLNYKQVIEVREKSMWGKYQNAAIASRWLLRKADQRFALPASW